MVDFWVNMVWSSRKHDTARIRSLLSAVNDRARKGIVPEVKSSAHNRVVFTKQMLKERKKSFHKLTDHNQGRVAGIVIYVF